MITIQNLTKKYGDALIFQNADFAFPDKGLVCLLGPSGCGKSTLLNMIAGFDCDYEGQITVWGNALGKMSAQELCAYRRDHIGFVFQNYCLLPGFTVLENIMLPCELSESDERNDLDHGMAILERAGMSAKANEKVENLSGGQKQRVAIARALMGDPQLILADEPTGALDRTNSGEIMEMLREISKSRLVLVITHDRKICDFADEVIRIQDRTIVAEQRLASGEGCSQKLPISHRHGIAPSAFRLGCRNFRVHLKRYLAIALAVSLGTLAFLLSLSSNNLMVQFISDFQDKNTAFQNGYIGLENGENDVPDLLLTDERIENVYYQYVLRGINLTIGDTSVTIAEEYPMPKATEAMSYGTMPKAGRAEISLSPSLAKKFSDQIQNLIGEEIVLNYANNEYRLTVSGIFNADYDDFFVSTDVEQKLYSKLGSEAPFSLNYDVKRFEDIVPVAQMLKENGFMPKTAAEEAAALQQTFQNLRTLFLVVSLLILAIGVFISGTLLVKLQNSRYRELGLLAALGFEKKTIQHMVFWENLLLSAMAAGMNAVQIGAAQIVNAMIPMRFSVTATQFFLSMLGTGMLVIIISIAANYKLVRTEPAQALRR